MLRLFIAVDLPAELRDQVAGLMEGVHNARWVNPGQLHVTLHFVGDTPEDEVAGLRDRLEGVKQDCFRLQLRGAGVFPEGQSRIKPPKVLWLGMEPATPMVRLKQNVHAALGINPMGKDQAFSPHLTLARFKSLPDGTLADFLDRNREFETRTWTVTCFHLYQSTLRQQGAVHNVLASYPLAPPARVE